MFYLLPLLHFVLGVFNCLPGVSWQEAQLGTVWYINPAEQILLGGVIGSLPWNIKIFVALLSDTVPIFGHRRVPYLVIGSILQGCAFLVLGLCGGPNDPGMFGVYLGFGALGAQQFISTMGQMLMGVMCDTLIVENMQYEVESGGNVGMIMTNCQLFFGIGGFVGNLLSGSVPQYLGVSILMMFVITGCGKLSVCLLASFMADPKFVSTDRFVRRFRATSDDIWQTMKLDRVLCPLIFIIVFAMSPGSGSSFNSYLLQVSPLCHYSANNSSCSPQLFDGHGRPVEAAVDFCGAYQGASSCDEQWGGLAFEPAQFQFIGVLASFGGMAGTWIFQRWFINAGWHKLVGGVVFIATAVSLLQLLLMFRDPLTGKSINERWHIPNIFFALGDDVVMAAANQLLAMPILILMAKICPKGAEGTVYSLVTSIQMLGGTFGNLIAENLTTSLGVTNVQFSKLWLLVLITSLCKFLSLFFMPLVPKSIESNQSDSKRSINGVVLLSFFAFGLIWALYQIAARVF